jgi:bifunctional aspartokinase / homoserine dehydrogenase 1
MGLIVMKFGGTSVGAAERIRQAAELVRETARESAVVVVVSALSGVTDAIVRALHAARNGSNTEVETRCRELETRHDAVISELFAPAAREAATLAARAGVARLREVCSGVLQLRTSTPQVHDMALSLGEEISAQLCALYLAQLGLACDYVDAARVVVTDDRFGEAAPDLDATRRKARQVLLPLLDSGRVPVVTGYRGATPTGQFTTLGRGGSDYSATLLGAAIGADEVWIWTDVDGVLTADPRLCPNASTLPEITFGEAVELSYYGAKVIHQRAIRPCMEAGIPVLIKNSFQPEAAGTRITPQGQAGSSPVKAVTAVTRASLVTLSTRWDVHFAEVFGRLLLRLAHEHVDVLFTTQSSSENALGLVLREHDTDVVVHAIKRLFRTELKHGVLNPIGVERDVAVVAVLGQAMKGVPGILARLFGAIARRNVSVIAVAQGASELNICFAVPSASAGEVVQAVHEEFFGTKEALVEADVVRSAAEPLLT